MKKLLPLLQLLFLLTIPCMQGCMATMGSIVRTERIYPPVQSTYKGVESLSSRGTEAPEVSGLGYDDSGDLLGSVRMVQRCTYIRTDTDVTERLTTRNWVIPPALSAGIAAIMAISSGSLAYDCLSGNGSSCQKSDSYPNRNDTTTGYGYLALATILGGSALIDGIYALASKSTEVDVTRRQYPVEDTRPCSSTPVANRVGSFRLDHKQRFFVTDTEGQFLIKGPLFAEKIFVEIEGIGSLWVDLPTPPSTRHAER